MTVLESECEKENETRSPVEGRKRIDAATEHASRSRSSFSSFFSLGHVLMVTAPDSITVTTGNYEFRREICLILPGVLVAIADERNLDELRLSFNLIWFVD